MVYALSASVMESGKNKSEIVIRSPFDLVLVLVLILVLVPVLIQVP
jgi:hypothetical protein